MAGRIPPETVDRILARTDIVDLINGRVQLKKAGSIYKACCPFHDEKTPSFTVTPKKKERKKIRKELNKI
jgi:DNA primase